MTEPHTNKHLSLGIISTAAICLLSTEIALESTEILGDTTSEAVRHFLDLATRALVLFALAAGIDRLRTPGERRFWALMVAAFASWFIADIAFQPQSDDPALYFSILEDGAFLLFYPLLMIAIEQRPCRFHWPISGWGSRLMCATAGLVLIIWAYVYLVVLTLIYAPDVFVEAGPSYLFFASADFVFAVIFISRAVLNRGRWRMIYGLLAVAMGIWGVTDLLDGLGILGLEPIPEGSPFDIFWSLPYFAVIASAIYRNRSAPHTPPIPTSAVHGRALVMWGFAYASTVPIIHLVVYSTGWLREIEAAREITVIVGLALLFAIALAIQARERRRQEVSPAPRIIVVEDEDQQAQKMEALGRLAGGVAHDFNNLLMVLQSQVDARTEELLSLPDGRRFVDELHTVVRRGSDLSRQLLSFGRKQVSQIKIIELGARIEEIEGLLRRTLGEHIELNVQIDDDVWPVAIDPGQLAQILINLALNARSAMTGSGRLSIEVSNVAVERGEIDEIDAGDFVQIKIADTGKGMDDATRTKIFEPFFSKHSAADGTGLGMAVVYGIVMQHGGTITCESEESVGTTFRVHLPRSRSQAEPEPAAEKTTAGTSKNNETLLIVEDEPDVREAVAEYLRASGYLVIEAGNGIEALAAAKATSMPIDLLITDVVMPRLGGPDLADRLTTSRPETAVLFVTGYAEDLPLHADRPLGREVLSKPYPLATLGEKVREILDHR